MSSCSKVFFAVGVVTVFLSLVALSLLEIIANLRLISATAGTLHLPKLFLSMGEGASQVALTETSLKLRTDASLEEPIEVYVV